MLKLCKISIVIYFFYSQVIFGQDIQFTQFYAAPTYLNPAFAGANVCSRATLLYRNQWPGISKTYRSYMFAYDHYLYKSNLGVGLNLGVDEAGSGDLRTTIINPIISYGVTINRFSSLRFGIQPGACIKSINFSKLLFGDQIYRGGKDVSTHEPQPQTVAFVDLGAGVLYNTQKFWFGFSAYHLNKPSDSFYNKTTVNLPIKYSVHSGMRLNLNNINDLFKVNDRALTDKKTMTFAWHYRHQNNFDQLDVGVYFTQYVFNIGLWYRGIPVFKSYKKGYPNNDAMALVVGISNERLNIGYSYDFTISYLSMRSYGAHEITFSYQLCNPKKFNKRKLTLISCPKF